MAGMNIVYVAPASPWPANFGGGMRVAALLAALERRARVRLIVVADEPGAEARDVLARRGAELWTPPRSGSLPRWSRLLRAAAAGRSIPAERFLEDGRRRLLVDSIADSHADLVILSDTFLAELAPPLRARGCRLVVDTFNVESELWRDVAAVSPSMFARVGYRLLASNTAALERRALPLAERVWAASEEDAAWYRRRLGLACVDVIPNVIDAGLANDPASARWKASGSSAAAFDSTSDIAAGTSPSTLETTLASAAPAKMPTSPDIVIYTGFFAYAPNEDAALRLLEVSRELQARGHVHRLHLVGRGPGPRLKKAAARVPYALVTGEVESIEPWLAGASVFAAPLRAGSGTKFKILQAMLAGLAVVTTSVGARGLGLEDGIHAYVRDGAGFGDAIADLLADPRRRAAIGEAGRRHVLERFCTSSLELALDRSFVHLDPGCRGGAAR
jgi:glycosyltransferase involved in cell wall biosynthesis